MERTKNYSKFCCVPGCRAENKSELSFHKPPKNEKVSEQWLLALKMYYFTPSMRVCSKHFTPQDFWFPDMATAKKNLKKGAIPSQELPLMLLTSKNSELIKQNEEDEVKVEKESFTASSQSTMEIDEEVNLQEMENEPTAMEVHLDTAENSMNAVVSADVTDADMNEINSVLPPPPPHHSEPKKFVDVGVQVDDFSFPWSRSTTHDKCIQVSVDTLERRDKSFVRMVTNNTELNAFTGVPSFNQFDNIESCMNELRESKGNKSRCALTLRELIFLVLMKLKLNLSFVYIAALCGVSSSTCQRYFYATLRDLSAILQCAIPWPEKDEILDNLPKCFERYRNTRIVIDCFEISIQRSKCLKCRLPSYSHYKSTHTVKVLVGVTPSGLISFVSKPFVGRASDKQVFVKSQLIEKLIPGVDCIMADKGFRIEDVCAKYSIQLIIPPFLSKKKQFSALESKTTADIAAARVHVERRIQRLRLFSVMKGPISINMLPYLNMIVQVVCGLSNLGPPIIAADKFL